jgi:hypothetical protein
VNHSAIHRARDGASRPNVGDTGPKTRGQIIRSVVGVARGWMCDKRRNAHEEHSIISAAFC